MGWRAPRSRPPRTPSTSTRPAASPAPRPRRPRPPRWRPAAATSRSPPASCRRSATSRLGSALVAADDADAESLKWKFHDPARLEDVPWRLSLLSQLDKAIETGEVWLAYQPKVELETGRTIGAEALARWTHPDKGPISPIEFISAAEQHDRIEPLTDFVLDKAVEAAARIGQRGIDFGIAVNLSARMLNDRRLPSKVAAILDKHRLDPARLTLELTETAAVSGSGNGIELLGALRELGVKIAIDDYGTGLSTLEYLKKIPASEIKIDQSFVKSMRDNRSDLIMVQSTIALAHSLGRTVVAEGVEDSPSPGAGKVSVTVDQLTRPGALVSGKVKFSDGANADWYLDQTGRLGVVPQQQGYKPSALDVQEFQMALEREMVKLGF